MIMKVLKFGGSSLESPENLLLVKEIIMSDPDKKIVVVSAFGKVTDMIIKTAKLAGEGNKNYKNILNSIINMHSGIIKRSVGAGKRKEVQKKVNTMLNEFSDILYGVYLIKELSLKTLDHILSFGELLSSFIFSNVINAILVDSREFIRTDSNFGKANVDQRKTRSLIKKVFVRNEDLYVVPGFIGCNGKKQTTTLGRGGSDYTASIIASALNVSILEIWTDVNGFMTADPGVINKAYVIDRLSYAEAMELSYFGAKVLYPPTILPVFQKNIPVMIRNTFSMEAPGTLISKEGGGEKGKKIKGISSINEISLVTIQGGGMVGVTGISMRLFGTLAKEDINIILISQASSENSISFAIRTEETEKAVEALKKEFSNEIALKQINKIRVENDLAIVAIVGENMKNTPGISGKLFNALGRTGINIKAIAQGASELNISFVVKTEDLRKTLNIVHEAFFLSGHFQLNLFLAGVGTVGKKLLDQIDSQSSKLLSEHKLKIKLTGITNSDKMYFDSNGIEAGKCRELLENSVQISSPGRFYTEMIKLNLYNSVFIDCTANEVVSGLYRDIINANISVVTANKIACSSAYSDYLALKRSSAEKGVKFLYETNVGAGLPIISTINDLKRSGDRIIKLEAVLSGTLNFIANTVSSEITISDSIRMAVEQGFAEPDPRIDLSGIDVARKLLILSREAGYELEADEIQIKPFIPGKYLNTRSRDEFRKLIKEYDRVFEAKRKQVEATGRKWRYVAILEEGKANIGLKAVDRDHPCYDLEGSNNIILITTERYDKEPMIIRGYGAGADVTAAGVFADIIRVANV